MRLQAGESRRRGKDSRCAWFRAGDSGKHGSSRAERLLSPAAILLLVAACGDQPAEARGTSPQPEAGSFAQWLNLQRGRFEEEADQALTDLQARIDALEKRLAELTGDARQAAEEKLAALKQDHEQMRHRLDEMRDAADDAWRDLRARVVRLAQDAQHELDTPPDGK